MAILADSAVRQVISFDHDACLIFALNLTTAMGLALAIDYPVMISGSATSWPTARSR